jgi:hypothetical protein
MEACKIYGTSKPRTHAPGLEGKAISSPSSRGRRMSLTTPLIDRDFVAVRSGAALDFSCAIIAV